MSRAFDTPRPWWQSLIAPVGVVAVGAFVSQDAFWIYLAITAATAFILTVSFNLIYGYAGIFSLAHVSVYGIGAYTACLVQMNYGVPFLLAVVGAMAFCAVVSVVLWWPTRHLKDLFLAIATLGFAVTVQEVMLKWSVTGGAEGLLGIPLASIAGNDVVAGTMAYYWLAAVGAVLAFEIAARTTSSGMGRKFVALRDAPVALSAVGVSPGRVRLVAFMTAGALAGLAGTLFAQQSLFIASESFGLDRLIVLILAVLIGGAGTQLGPVVGVVALVFIDEAGVASGGYNTLILGLAIMLLLGYGRGGLMGVVDRVVRLARRDRVAPLPVEPRDLTFSSPRADAVLTVDDVAVDFGGVHALEGVSLDVRSGEVLGLIGPNGAGKTTLVNVITGHVTPTSGSVTLDGDRISGRRPHEVPRSGVVRTFQTPRLLPDVTVVGNVALGFAQVASAHVLGEIVDSRRARYDSRDALGRAAGLLHALGVEDGLTRPAGTQPYAAQRLTEIARALATSPAFVLLDEPGAGLSEQERQILAEVIRQLAAAGIGIILIDHNVSFVASVADRVHVLDRGRTLATGQPTEVLESRAVVAAYFGGGA